MGTPPLPWAACLGHQIWISDHEHKSPIITIKGKEDSLLRKKKFYFFQLRAQHRCGRDGKRTTSDSLCEKARCGVKDGGKAVVTAAPADYYHYYFNLRALLHAAAGHEAKTSVLPAPRELPRQRCRDAAPTVRRLLPVPGTKQPSAGEMVLCTPTACPG